MFSASFLGVIVDALSSSHKPPPLVTGDLGTVLYGGTQQAKADYRRGKENERNHQEFELLQETPTNRIREDQYESL
ncbi:unnamed protein product [Urochloa humidicola]